MSWAALPVEPACIGETCGGKRGVRSCLLDWLGRELSKEDLFEYAEEMRKCLDKIFDLAIDERLK